MKLLHERMMHSLARYPRQTAVVDEQDAHGDRGAGGHRVVAQPPRHGHAAADDGDHGA